MDESASHEAVVFLRTPTLAGGIYEETKDPKYSPPLLLRKIVTAGRLGKKSGKEFYDHK